MAELTIACLSSLATQTKLRSLVPYPAWCWPLKRRGLRQWLKFHNSDVSYFFIYSALQCMVSFGIWSSLPNETQLSVDS
jgi:hypothetical protein